MFATNMTLFLWGSSKVRGQKGEEKTIAHKIKNKSKDIVFQEDIAR